MQVTSRSHWIDNASQTLASLKPNQHRLAAIFGKAVSLVTNAPSVQRDGALFQYVRAPDGAEKSQFLDPCFDNMPEQLKKMSRWIVWRAEGGTDLKPTKIPYDPTLPTKCRASSTDPQTWGSYEQAVAAYMEGGYTGIAFVLNDDGIVGIDLDKCVSDGVPSAPAMSLLAKLGVEYVELSPSGTGLRAFGYAEKLETGVNGNLDGLKVELYSGRRFLTITGHVLQCGALVRLHGFAELANEVRNQASGRSVSASIHGAVGTTQEERHGVWIRQVINGDVYHDSLRNLAGSMIASNMYPGAVVSSLRGLMNATFGPRDGRWKARMEEIPRLVDSAVKKFSAKSVNINRIMNIVQAEQEAAANDAAPLVTRFKVLSAAAVAQSAPIAWMIRGLLPKTGLAGLYGASGSGKSFLTLDLCASVAAGAVEWYGRRVSTCPVTYCVLEGEAGIGKRVAAWEAHHKKKISDNLRFIVQSFDITLPADVEELAVAVRAAGGADGLIVLDTLNRAAPGVDENSSKDMGMVIANAKALQQVVGGIVLLVHHTGKDETKGMRGHSSLFAAMDAVLFVSKTKEKGLSWGIAKSKDDATGAMHPFYLEQVIVGVDDEGEDVTSCVAVSQAPPFALRNAKRLGKHQQVALEVLDSLFLNAKRNNVDVDVETATQAVADALDVDAKHARERAKEAIEALQQKLMIEIDGRYLSRPTPIK